MRSSCLLLATCWASLPPSKTSHSYVNEKTKMSKRSINFIRMKTARQVLKLIQVFWADTSCWSTHMQNADLETSPLKPKHRSHHFGTSTLVLRASTFRDAAAQFPVHAAVTWPEARLWHLHVVNVTWLWNHKLDLMQHLQCRLQGISVRLV